MRTGDGRGSLQEQIVPGTFIRVQAEGLIAPKGVELRRRRHRRYGSGGHGRDRCDRADPRSSAAWRTRPSSTRRQRAVGRHAEPDARARPAVRQRRARVYARAVATGSRTRPPSPLLPPSCSRRRSTSSSRPARHRDRAAGAAVGNQHRRGRRQGHDHRGRLGRDRRRRGRGPGRGQQARGAGDARRAHLRPRSRRPWSICPATTPPPRSPA